MCMPLALDRRPVRVELCRGKDLSDWLLAVAAAAEAHGTAAHRLQAASRAAGAGRRKGDGVEDWQVHRGDHQGEPVQLSS